MCEMSRFLTDCDDDDRAALVKEFTAGGQTGDLLVLHLFDKLAPDVGCMAEAILRGVDIGEPDFEQHLPDGDGFRCMLAALVTPHIDAVLHERFEAATPFA